MSPNERVASSRLRFAAAGAAAATVWAMLEPLDRRLFRYGYSDVALLGTFVTLGPRWRVAGLVVHAANGAVFGLAYRTLRGRYGTRALPLALAEHVALFPLGAFVDRYHPARGTSGLPKLMSPRAFAQATVRHAVFGVVLGRLAR